MNKYIAVLGAILLCQINATAQSDNNASINSNKFAFSIFEKLFNEKKNTLVSPLSISFAMAMTYEGAAGKTAKEFVSVMQFDKNKKQHHQNFVSLISSFNDTTLNKMVLCNALMAQKDYYFNEDYIKSLNEYGALLQYADFRDATEREAARRGLNKWVENQTESKIVELLQPGIIDELTRLVLVNAVYFKAKWAIEFNPKKTRQMIFYGIEKQFVVPFMHGREDFNYYEDSLMQILELPYSGNKFSMVVFLPKNEVGLANFINGFDAESYEMLTIKLEKHRVDVLLPSFTVSDESNLKDVFQTLGMNTAFNGKANFKGMNGKKNLLIKDVVHKTYIKVDESGTEAAGSTAVVIREKSAPAEKPVFFNANRSFFYVIKDNATNTIIFLGSINKPTN